MYQEKATQSTAKFPKEEPMDTPLTGDSLAYILLTQILYS